MLPKELVVLRKCWSLGLLRSSPVPEGPLSDLVRTELQVSKRLERLLPQSRSISADCGQSGQCGCGRSLGQSRSELVELLRTTAVPGAASRVCR